MPVRHPSAALRAQIIHGQSPMWLRKHPRQPYLTALYLATPYWITRDHFKDLITRRDLLTKATGIEHVLDHIVPLNHPLVCGLNVPWNMQILTRAQNSAKSNIWCPDQLELEL